MKKIILFILIALFIIGCVPQINKDDPPPAGIDATIPALTPPSTPEQCTNNAAGSFLDKIAYFFINPIKAQIEMVSLQIFINIVGGSNYISIVTILLVLYIAIYGIGFTTGTVQMNVTDLVSRIFKIGVVLTLTSQTSYNFFNTYLFQLFTLGSQELLSIASNPYCGASSPGEINFFSFMDNIISILTSPTALLQITALLWAFPVGWICIVVLLMCVVKYFLAALKAIIAYLFAYTAIGFLIALAPIFIILILFEHTRHIFQNWIKLLGMCALQPMILFSGLAIMNIIISETIYNLFGECQWGAYMDIAIDLGCYYHHLFYLNWLLPTWWCNPDIDSGCNVSGTYNGMLMYISDFNNGVHIYRYNDQNSQIC